MLDLSKKYTLIDKKYIPLEQSAGAYCCDNCGKLIANIAVVKNNDNLYNIGFDCLENILKNNLIIEGISVELLDKYKKMIPKILRFSKQIKETIEKNKHINITGIKIEDSGYGFYPFYWLKNNEKTSRDNDYIKLKDVDFNFLIDSLKNIFPKLDIITK